MTYLLFTKGLINKLLMLILNVIRICDNDCIYNEIPKQKGDKNTIQHKANKSNY